MLDPDHSRHVKAEATPLRAWSAVRALAAMAPCSTSGSSHQISLKDELAVHTEAASLPWPANQIFTVPNFVQLLKWKGHTIGRLRATSCEERHYQAALL